MTSQDLIQVFAAHIYYAKLRTSSNTYSLLEYTLKEYELRVSI